jgi:prolyl 4-hydroxylase
MERVNVAEDPKIRFVKGFLAPEACDRIIEKARQRTAPAQVYNLTIGENAPDQTVNHSQANLLLPPDVQQQISEATGLPAGAVDEFGVVNHYRPGETFSIHSDALVGDAPGVVEELRLRGQRLVSFLIYLNDDYEAGETAFPRLNMHIKGRKGDALYWANVDGQGRQHPLAFHGGLPTTHGEKWTLALMIRNKVRSA